MELGLVEAAIISELTIHIPNTATRYDMQDLFREYGLIQNMNYDYSLFIRNVPDTWAQYGNWLDASLDGAQGGSPPFVIQLFADILMGTPNAIYGFTTGRDWRTGNDLTGWDYVWNSLEIIPAAGVFAKTFKNGVKGLKVYNKGTGVVFDVIQAAKQLPKTFASKLSTLQQKGLQITASIENELYLVVGQTKDELLKIKNEVVEILKPYTGTSNQPQWSLDLGNMQVKIGDDVVEQSVEIRKYGNDVRVVAKSMDKSSVIAKLEAIGNLTQAKNFVNTLDEISDAALLIRLNKLTNLQLQKLNEFYTTIKSPAGYNGQFSFTVTKTINGSPVSIKYTYGLPDLRAHSPVFNFTDGTAPSKFKYKSATLNGGSSDFNRANTALAKKFGIEKIGGNWPWQNGYMTSGNFRLVQTNSGGISQQFELLENGIWTKYTWHHFEDGRTLFPVKTPIHSVPSGFNHSGGKSIISKQIQDLFEFHGF